MSARAVVQVDWGEAPETGRGEVNSATKTVRRRSVQDRTISAQWPLVTLVTYLVNGWGGRLRVNDNEEARASARKVFRQFLPVMPFFESDGAVRHLTCSIGPITASRLDHVRISLQGDTAWLSRVSKLASFCVALSLCRISTVMYPFACRSE